MFELPNPTTALLSSVTNRPEHHGEDIAPGVSFGLTIEGSSALLETLAPQVRPLLGVQGVDSVKLKTVCQGWVVTVEHGISDDSPIKMGGCKVDGFKVSPKNDGMVELKLRVGTNDLQPLPLGLLGMKVGQEVTIRMTAPRGATQTDTEDQAKALKKQQALEDAGQGRLDDEPEQDTPMSALGRAVGHHARKANRKAAHQAN